VAKELSLRRMPQQARGQRRIDKLLDAAEQVFSEKGYGDATTNLIAARAQTSIGSLYQFFPNKEAILRAIVARYVEELRAFFAQTLSVDADKLPLASFLEHLIQGLAKLREAHAGFRPLFFGSQSFSDVEQATQELRQEVIERIVALLAVRAPQLDEEQRLRCAHVCVAVFQALMALAMAVEGEERVRLLEELKAVLLANLMPLVHA
jgi:AcrR family transcriptional regulator